MKKALGVFLAVVLLLSLTSTVVLAANGNGNGNGANVIEVNGAHYNLNLIGKKADWNDKSGFDNPDRHTIFIPEATSTFSYVNPLGDTVTGSIKLEIGQDKNAEDIYVTDGTAFDGDGTVGIMMPEKKYYVFIASRGKPNGETNIDAMVYYDSTLGEWLYCIGEVSVSRGWKTAEDLFWVTQEEHDESPLGIALGGTLPEDPMWIFDYLEWLATLNAGEADPSETMEYYWDITNNGNKLIKLRFYPMN